MRERVEAIVGEAAAACGSPRSTPPACASCAARPKHFGLTANFTIYDSADPRALLKRIIKELDADTFGFTARKRRRPRSRS